MVTGAFLASEFNDQYSSGYAYRAWAAEWWKKLGHVPLWNPDIFGGMPFLAGMSGDVLYPTAWLRLILPTHVAMNLGFAIHYVLAGLFMYWFLRCWRVSWTGAVVGGLAYQLSGVIGSYVSPGHDGKLFVTTMLPLLLVGLTLGVRDRRLQGFAVAALAVGLIMLSPHPQMAEYALLAAGIYTLFLVFGAASASSSRWRALAIGLALAAVFVGVAISAAQYLPFYAYIRYSPRDAAVLNDYAWSAAYAIPWAHVPEFVIPRFTGESFNGSYWGPNGLKLHSEYLGLAVVALAIVGVRDRERRRMVVWLSGIALLFLLIALGSATPFFRLWWAFVPFAKSTRAPGMALYIVVFVMATCAAFGTDRILRDTAGRFPSLALVVGSIIAVLAIVGGWGLLARSLGGPANASAIAAETLQWSAVVAGLALTLVGLATRLNRQRRLSARAVAIAVIAIIGSDLWLNARAFWIYSRAPEELFAGDAIKARLRGIRPPFRVWDVEVRSRGVLSVYPGAALMADDIPQLYGHHGNEPHAFDLLNGRIGSSLTFRRAGNARILDLFAVNYLIVQAGPAPDSIPGFRRTISSVTTSSGNVGTLFERERPSPYARLVPLAVSARMDTTLTRVLDPAFPVDRVVLIDSAVAPTPLSIPNQRSAAVPNAVTVEDWVPGQMHLRLAQPTATASYLVVSENWDRPWRAWVDGRETQVLRGDATLITVPLPAGARAVELRYKSPEYERGKLISVVALLVALAGIAAPMVVDRVRRQKQ